MTKTSSTDAPARISCGIDFFVPQPSSVSLIMRGTMTAGDTAPTTAPMIAASRRDTPRKIGARIIIPVTSKQAGTKHIRIAGRPAFFKSSRFKDNPALSKMMINAIRRSCDEISRMDESSQPSPYGPRIIPVAIIPTSPGSLTFLHSHPSAIPSSSINAILCNIFFLLFLA